MPVVAQRIALILCLCLTWGVSFAKGHHQHRHRPATASADSKVAHAALVADAASGAVLHAYNAGEPWYPASLTKMMTAYLAFDAMESGRLKASDTLMVSRHAAAQKGSRIGLRLGERITLDDALRGLIVRSANDAAVAIAEHVGGNEGDFAASMTAKARQIGMSHTTFHNATGLPHPQQITTAHDMAVLSVTLIRRFPSHYHYFQTDSITFHKRNMGAINPLLKSYPGAEGMKTGFTCASGYNIVGAAKRYGRRIIAVYLGGSSRQRRNTEVTRLLDAGFADSRDAMGLPELDDASVISAVNLYPIHRLGSNVCYSTVPAENSTSNASPRRGWSVVLGDFPHRKDGQNLLKRLRSDSPNLLAHGQASIITRNHGKGEQQYAALFTGLLRNEADQLCNNRPQQRNVSCATLSPIVLRASR